MLNYPKRNPWLSIVVPTFNRRAYLERCFDSVVLQTFTDWELIIVDDGSTDGSWNVIADYVDRDRRIQAIRQQNKGPSLARNAGMLLAVGKYLTFIDSDDQYKPQHLEKRINFMRAHPEVDVLHGGYQVIGDPHVADKHDTRNVIHLSRCAVGGTLFGKRKVFIQLGGFYDVDYSEDSDLYERAAARFKVVEVDFPTYVYDRTTPGSITNTKMLEAAT